MFLAEKKRLQKADKEETVHKRGQNKLLQMLFVVFVNVFTFLTE